MTNNFYPKSPVVDKKFTKINSSYQNNVVVVLLSIILFFILYFSLIATSIYLVYFAVSYEIGNVNRYTILLKIGLIGMSIMFSLFIIKFLFKKQTNNNPANIEIKKNEHPNLFNFIKKLSEETNAPFPKKVFVNHEINASVFYNSTFLSLFIPTKKNLLIGLGLVNSINLTEFKAVIAHEFGHFSQSSMKLGSYVYMTNRIIHGMVYERDYWDEMFDKWTNSDARIAIFGWLLMPIVWVTRQLMVLIYQGINILQSSLSRQMEFHADLVAVSVTGSNAIINGLYKLNAATEAMNFATEHVNSAIQNKLYTTNLFIHQKNAFKYLKENNSNFSNLLLKNQKSNRVFLKDDDGDIPLMYASHPSGYKREDNAKKEFIDGIEDDRSPWILFNNPDELCEKVTKNLLRINLDIKNDSDFSNPEKVELFIKSEIEETHFNNKYKGNYESRFITDLDENILKEVSQDIKLPNVNYKNIIDELYGTTLDNRLILEKKYNDEIVFLSNIVNKINTQKKFIYKNIEYKRNEAQKLLDVLIKEIESDQWYDEFDKKILTTHITLASKSNKDELIERYRFHLKFQKNYKSNLELQNYLFEKINELQNLGSIDENQIKVYGAEFKKIQKNLLDSLNYVDKLIMPKMNNFDKVSSLKSLLLEDEIVYIPGHMIDGERINKFVNQFNSLIETSRRVYFKSLGSILNLQEKIYDNNQ